MTRITRDGVYCVFEMIRKAKVVSLEFTKIRKTDLDLLIISRDYFHEFTTMCLTKNKYE